jgi:hypothetical protein
MTWHLRENTLKIAIAQIANYQHRLALAQLSEKQLRAARTCPTSRQAHRERGPPGVQANAAREPALTAVLMPYRRASGTGSGTRSALTR